VPNVAVFCDSFVSCFPGVLLMYFLNDFEMVPVAPIILLLLVVVVVLVLGPSLLISFLETTF
jgi:hypothetical protein